MKKTGKARFSALLIIILFTAVSPYIHAENIVNVQATVDANRIGLIDTLALTVEVEAENIARIPSPHLPELASFNILNESAKTQTSISIVNGKTARTKKITYTYILQPKHIGTFVIDPISIRYKGQELRTESISIEVVEGQVKTGQQEQISPQEGEIDLQKLREDVFIRVQPESGEIYEGEQLLLTYTLYSRIDIESISLKESPEFPGFYKEEIFNATRLEYKNETYNERLYNASLLKKIALFPINPGRFSPRPLVLEMTVLFKNEDFFTLFGKPYTFLVKSTNVKIDVKPLPENKTKKPFSHIVGDLSAQLSKRENTVNTGESTICYLTLKSSGNLNSVSDPGIQLSKRGRVYLSETMVDRVEENGMVYFVKKFEYTVIPEERGILTISTEDLVYFDIATTQYDVIRPEPVEINITGESIYQEKPIIGTKQLPSEGGFIYIKRDLRELKSTPPSPFSQPSFYLYHIILVAATGILFFIRLKRESIEKNELVFKKKKARSFASRKLAQAQKAIAEKQFADAADLILQALTMYIAHKSGKSVQEVTKKRVKQLLGTTLGIEEGVQNEVHAILEQCSMFKFSQNNVPEQTRIESIYQSAVSVIESIEISLSSGILSGSRRNTKSGAL
jgi:hypothetical protein